MGGQLSPHSPERGQEFCLSYQKHLWNASGEQRELGPPPQAGGLAPRHPVEGLLEGGGYRRPVLGVQEPPS